MPSTKRREAQPKQDQEAHLPRAGVGARFVSAYQPDLALEIVERLAEGETLNAICKGQPGMPHPKTFKRWVVSYPDLAKAVLSAYQLSASSLEEEALDTARAIALLPKDGTHVRAAEVKLQQLRWSMERRDPGKFGAKGTVNIKVPIQIITPMDLGGGSEISSLDIYTIQPRTIEATAKDITPPAPLVQEESTAARPRAPTGPRKRVLVPRNPFYVKEHKDANPSDADVREQGGEPSQPRLAGPRYTRPDLSGAEEGSHEEEAGQPGQAPASSGESQ